MGGRGFLGNPQILLIQARAKARREVAGQDPLAMDLEHPARREAAEKSLAHARRVDARLACERERLADAGERAPDRDLIADLADLSRARLADVDDSFGIAHAAEHRPHAGEDRLVATHHD